MGDFYERAKKMADFAQGRTGDFTVLPVWGGVGDWHFNRYRAVFKRPPNLGKQLLAADFVANFPQYLTSRYAKVLRTDRTYATMPTFHFHGTKMKALPSPVPYNGRLPEVDLAAPHSDWVVKIDDNANLGFTAQTLKREFNDLFKDSAVDDGAGLATLIAPTLAFIALRFDDPVQVNRMHFLAEGLRSWRLDDGKNFEVDGDVMVIETTAVERFSHKLFARADGIAGMKYSRSRCLGCDALQFPANEGTFPVGATYATGMDEQGSWRRLLHQDLRKLRIAGKRYRIRATKAAWLVQDAHTGAVTAAHARNGLAVTVGMTGMARF